MARPMNSCATKELSEDLGNHASANRAAAFADGKEMVMPGDNVSITVKLINPIAMEEGLRFAIREGGRTVGAGVVAKIIE